MFYVNRNECASLISHSLNARESSGAFSDAFSNFNGIASAGESRHLADAPLIEPAQPRWLCQTSPMNTRKSTN